MTLVEFFERYRTEEQCRAVFERWRWPSGFVCPLCGHDEYCRLALRDHWQCNRCRRQISLTSSTPMRRTQLPLTSWFLALYLLETNPEIPTIEIGRALGISFNTARRVKRRAGMLLSGPYPLSVLDPPPPLDEAPRISHDHPAVTRFRLEAGLSPAAEGGDAL